MAAVRGVDGVWLLRPAGPACRFKPTHSCSKVTAEPSLERMRGLALPVAEEQGCAFWGVCVRACSRVELSVLASARFPP